MTPDRGASEWLGTNGPRDEDEASAVARALLAHREDEEAVAALDDLAEFERQLLAAAWHAGHAAARATVAATIGSAAETVSALVLRQALDGPVGTEIDVRRAEEIRPFLGVGTSGRLRAARLVATARRRADQISSREAPQ